MGAYGAAHLARMHDTGRGPSHDRGPLRLQRYHDPQDGCLCQKPSPDDDLDVLQRRASRVRQLLRARRVPGARPRSPSTNLYDWKYSDSAIAALLRRRRSGGDIGIPRVLGMCRELPVLVHDVTALGFPRHDLGTLQPRPLSRPAWSPSPRERVLPGQARPRGHIGVPKEQGHHDDLLPLRRFSSRSSPSPRTPSTAPLWRPTLRSSATTWSAFWSRAPSSSVPLSTSVTASTCPPTCPRLSRNTATTSRSRR